MGCATPVAFTSVTSAMAIMSDAFTRSLIRRFLTPTEWEHTGISAQSVRPQQSRRKVMTFLPPGVESLRGLSRALNAIVLPVINVIRERIRLRVNSPGAIAANLGQLRN